MLAGRLRGPGHRRWALLLAAALCAVGLGVVWQTTVETTGQVTTGTPILVNRYNWSTESLDLEVDYLPGYYVPGDPRAGLHGYEADVRIVLAPAVVVLAWAAVRPGPGIRRAAAVVAVGLVACAVVALSDRRVVPLVLAGAAAGLAWLATRRPVTPPGALPSPG